MNRNPNTDRNGGAWTHETKSAVWYKASAIPDYDSNVWRRDKCGKVIKWSEHGNRNSENGWEIDHINPVSNGGGDHIDNLQPLHWSNNASKADSLNWRCP